MSHPLKPQRNTQPQPIAQSSKRRSYRGLLGVLSVAAGAVIVMNVVLLQRSQPAAPLPTLIALVQSTELPITPSVPSATPEATQTTAAIALPTNTRANDLVNNDATALMPISTAVPAEKTAVPVSALPQNVQQDRLAPPSNNTSLVVISTAMPTVSATDTIVEALPTLSDETSISPTATTTQVMSLPSTVQPTIAATSFVSGIVESGVPLSQGLDTAIGQIRVIAATRNAEAVIRDLGGVMPPAPANQAWLLVEVLLICHEQSTCAVSPSSFSVLGASGMQYPVSSQLMITPLLGSTIANGQAWGYLGFTIPTNETLLRLVMKQGNLNSVFALQ